MIPLHTILHPTDFSERSTAAFQFACALAKDYSAQLIVLHAVPPGTADLLALLDVGAQDPSEDIDAPLWEQLRRIQPPDAAVRVEHRLEEGHAAATIVRQADLIHADLIVMGTHGRTGLNRVVLGSVAELVVRQAGCPVVTVKMAFPRRVRAETPAAADLAIAVGTAPMSETVKG